MGHDIKQIFSHLPHEKLSASTPQLIMARIRAYEIRRKRAGAFAFFGLSFTSAGATLWAIGSALKASEQSGFTDYVSLAFSDSGSVLNHLSSFGYSLLEAFPSVEVAVTLLLLAVCITTFSQALRSLAPMRNVRLA
jgi:hypothetical protein